jgi:hypothetical protein
MYRTLPEYIQGKLTKKTVGRLCVDDTLRAEIKNQQVYTDEMHVDGVCFLVSVSVPLYLRLQCKIEIEGSTEVGMALQAHLAILRSWGFVPTVVNTDYASVFRAITQVFPGVEIDIAGAEEYVAMIDSHICWMKEQYCSIKSGSTWELPRYRVKDLVAYAVSRLNIRHASDINTNVCPRVLFTGIKPNFKK